MMKYKKLVAFLTISFSLVIGCALKTFAEDGSSLDVDFQSVPMQMDLMKFEAIPTSIALSENGIAAFSYDQGNRRFVVVFFQNGAVKQYSFQTSGSYVLKLEKNILSIYLFRSYKEICLNLLNEQILVRECDVNQVIDFERNLKGVDRLTSGENVLERVIENGHYCLYLNGNLILQTTTTALIGHYLGMCVPFVILFTGGFMAFKRLLAEIKPIDQCSS